MRLDQFFVKVAVVLSFASGLPSFAQAESANFSAGRFAALITSLEASLQRIAKSEGFFSLSADEQAGQFKTNGTRLDAFNLQSLGRLYRDYPIEANRKFVSAVREEAKDLEDAIGEYEKYKDSNKDKHAKKAAKELMSLVAKKGWMDRQGRSPLLQKMKSQLVRLSWLPNNEERRFVLSQLVAQIDDIKGTQYDMRKLEAGLHELRRELRWFTISAKSLDGLVVASPRLACPQTRLIFTENISTKYGIPTQSRYQSPCVVSACLSSELLGAVGTLGKLKDEAEPIVLDDENLQKKDITPARVASEAQKVYSALLQSQLLDNTREQIQACLK